jgi:hypothetical protein
MGGRNSPAFRTLLSVVITVLVLAVPPVALAGKGSGGGKQGGGATSGGGSLSVAMVADTNQNGLPNWGDTIRFNVSTNATTEPHVNLTCSQNGVVVYGAATGYYASYPWPWTQNMTLSSQSWTGGAADCTAVLSAYSGTSSTTLATLSFHVAP